MVELVYKDNDQKCELIIDGKVANTFTEDESQLIDYLLRLLRDNNQIQYQSR